MVENPKWTIKTDDPDPEKIIDYESVYVWFSGHPNYEYRVLRFWPTGQVMVAYFLEVENLGEKMSIFVPSSYGNYFKMKGREIEMESFNALYHTYKKGSVDAEGNIVITRGGVYKTGIKKMLTPEDADVYKLQPTYKRIKVNLEPLTPDW